ncbi:hypothetical protein V3C99_014280 [Haemonchus contortus]|nr:Glycosyl transferase domain containing protein [Haemonchus contortus]
MSTPNYAGSLRSIGELLVTAGTIYLYITWRIFYCAEVFHDNEDPTANRVIFKNTTIKYKYIALPNISACNTAENQIVALVPSTPQRFAQRQAVRESWASPTLSKSIADGLVAVFFIVGAPKTAWRMSKLVKEQQSYGDLIVTDIEESYENLVFKVNAAMRFFLTCCYRTGFMMKIDDDVIISFDRMLEHWIEAERDKNKIYCQVWSGISPDRDPTRKWHIPYELYQEEKYPNYCDGPIYLIGRSALCEILSSAERCYEPFPLEDVFYTGILASEADIPRIDWRLKIYSVDENSWDRKIVCDDHHNPITFAISSFKSTKNLVAAFQTLSSFECAES